MTEYEEKKKEYKKYKEAIRQQTLQQVRSQEAEAKEKLKAQVEESEERLRELYSFREQDKQLRKEAGHQRSQ